MAAASESGAVGALLKALGTLGPEAPKLLPPLRRMQLASPALAHALAQSSALERLLLACVEAGPKLSLSQCVAAAGMLFELDRGPRAGRESEVDGLEGIEGHDEVTTGRSLYSTLREAGGIPVIVLLVASLQCQRSVLTPRRLRQSAQDTEAREELRGVQAAAATAMLAWARHGTESIKELACAGGAAVGCTYLHSGLHGHHSGRWFMCTCYCREGHKKHRSCGSSCRRHCCDLCRTFWG